MRILLGFILALSISFACDKPYEEVGGYKIGCPLDTKGMLHHEDVVDANIEEYSEILTDSFFQVASTTILNGTLEGVMFFSEYDNENMINRDTSNILENLEARWGAYHVADINNSDAYIFDKSNSDTMDDVRVIVKKGYSPVLGVIYTSKKLKYHNDNQENIKNAERNKKLSGF